MIEVKEVKSVSTGDLKALPRTLYQGDDDRVGDLRDAVFKALQNGKLHFGLKQVLLFRDTHVLEDDSLSLREALQGEVPRYSILGPEVYKDNVNVPEEPKKAAHVIKTVEFPEPTGININMMPIVIGVPNSIPEEYRHYAPLVAACFGTTPPQRIGYLTINEGTVEAGTTQRRGGLHIECPGYLTGGVVSHGKWSRVTDCFGNDRGEKFEGGIYMASTVSNSNCFWRVKIDDPGEVAGALGDLEHIRSLLPENRKTTPAAGQLVWFTDTTPHEALPIASSGPRQFFRLVVGDLSQWNEKHNTKNPLGVKPDPTVTKTVDYDKFDLSFNPPPRFLPLKRPMPCSHITAQLDGLNGENGSGLYGGDPSGLGFLSSESVGCPLAVAFISKASKISDWNTKNPTKVIDVWDRLVAIDGTKYKYSPHLSAATESITVMRGKPLAVAPGDGEEHCVPWAGLQAWFDAKDVKLTKEGIFVHEWHCKAGTGNVLRREHLGKQVVVDSAGIVALTTDQPGGGQLALDWPIAGCKTQFWVSHTDHDDMQYVSRRTRVRFFRSGWQEFAVNNDLWPAKTLRAWCREVDDDTEGERLRNFSHRLNRPHGQNGEQGVHSPFHVAEVLFYNRILSDKEVDSVLNYLAKKWNLAE